MKKNIIDLHQDKYVINISNDEYEMINYIIDYINNKYGDKLSMYNNIKYDSLDIINNKTVIVRSIIEDIISFYDEINKYDATVFLAGSYARCSNKSNSDIDLQFSYPVEYKDKMIKYEEIIDYIISRVLNINRSKVHAVLVSKIDKDFTKIVDDNISKNNFVFEIKSESNLIKYEYDKYIKKRVYLTYDNDNSLEATFKYLKTEISGLNREWAHVLYPLTNKEKFYKLYNDLYEYEKSILSIDKIDNRKNRILEKIVNINKLLNELDLNNMINFKKVFQVEEFSLINEYISLLRDKNLLSGNDWQFINYYDNYKYFKNDEIFNYVFNYIFLFFNIVKDFGNKFSIHNCSYIDFKKYAMLEEKLIDLNEKIGKVL